MCSFLATTPDELGRISTVIHDAEFDQGKIVYDESRRRLVIAFAQEAGQCDELPQKEVVKRSWLSTTYRVPLVRGTLTIEDVLAVEAPEDWGYFETLLGIGFDARSGELRVTAAMGSLHVSVGKLHVEAEMTPEIDRYICRRIPRFLPAATDTRSD